MIENSKFKTLAKGHQVMNLSAEEFWYLLNLLGQATVIGIENPYLGCLIENIKIGEQSTSQALLHKGLIALSDDNNLYFFDELLKSMVETCHNPNHCLWLIASQNEKEKTASQRFVYFSSKQMVDLVKDNEQNYQLTVVPDPNSLNELLRESFQESPDNKPATSDFVLEQSVFDGVIKTFGMGDSQRGRQLLSSTSLQDQAIHELESASGNDGKQMIAINIHNPTQPDQCYMNGYGYVTGQMGGWIIQEYEQDKSKFIRFEPGTIHEFQERVFSMIGS